jgi:hypothetical protein
VSAVVEGAAWLKGRPPRTALDPAALLAAVEQNIDALVAVLTAGPSGTGLAANPDNLDRQERSPVKAQRRRYLGLRARRH